MACKIERTASCCAAFGGGESSKLGVSPGNEEGEEGRNILHVAPRRLLVEVVGEFSPLNDIDLHHLTRLELLKEHLDVQKVILMLKKYGCPEAIVQDVQRIYTQGAPSKFNYHSSRKNFFDFFRYGNHPTIRRNKIKVLKAVNKEDKYNYVIPLPVYLARFVPNIHLTPMSLLEKKGKNDRMTDSPPHG